VDREDAGTVAFIANGFSVTVAQRDACLAVMQGSTFTSHDTERAMIAAGVPAKDWTAMRAADRLRQTERRRGNIRPIKGKLGAWERVSMTAPEAAAGVTQGEVMVVERVRRANPIAKNDCRSCCGTGTVLITTGFVICRAPQCPAVARGYAL